MALQTGTCRRPAARKFSAWVSNSSMILESPGTPGLSFFRHKGIYGFRRSFLLEFVSWEPSVLEQVEGLEQLRAMENGARISVILTNDQSPGIDTPDQAALLEQQLLGEIK